MIGTRTVLCFVFFALIFGKPSAQEPESTKSSETHENGSGSTLQSEDGKILHNTTTPVSRSPHNNMDNKTQDIKNTSNDTKQTTEITETPQKTNTQSTCATTPSGPKADQCIFTLSTGEPLHLLLVALVMACFALLLTTIICACQVCHLRSVISSLRPHYDIGPRAVRDKSHPTHRDENQADGQPTETCLMLSEVTPAQEQEKNIEENKIEEKSEEQKEPDPTVSDLNGDVALVASQKPDEQTEESVYTEVKEP